MASFLIGTTAGSSMSATTVNNRSVGARMACSGTQRRSPAARRTSPRAPVDERNGPNTKVGLQGESNASSVTRTMFRRQSKIDEGQLHLSTGSHRSLRWSQFLFGVPLVHHGRSAIHSSLQFGFTFFRQCQWMHLTEGRRLWRTNRSTLFADRLCVG